MEWFLLYVIPCLLAGIVSLVCRNVGVVCAVAVMWGVVLFLGVRLDWFDSAYSKWQRKGCPGDHAWFEWQRCKESYVRVMAAYDARTYCKIGFGSFVKYFHVNPDRYGLQWGYVVFDDEDEKTEIRMVFPRRDLWKYFRFRRVYLQSRQMVSVMSFVQADIEKSREEALAEIERARALMRSELGGIELK